MLRGNKNVNSKFKRNVKRKFKRKCKRNVKRKFKRKCKRNVKRKFKRKGVVGGMLAATILAIFFVPVFFVIVMKLFRTQPYKIPKDA